MNRILFSAGLVTCMTAAGLVLASCGEKPADPAATAATAPKKSLARPAPLYAGQAQVLALQTGTATAAGNGGVDLAVTATTDGSGWTQAGFLPRVYAATPPDGVYEVDVVAQAPASPGGAGPAPVKVSSAWDRYTDGRVKGEKFISRTNEIVAMLPAAK